MALRSAVILNTLTGALAIAVASSFSSKPRSPGNRAPEPREVGLRAPKPAQLAYQAGWVNTSARLDSIVV